MGQVERLRACNRSQSLALSREKALPVGHTDRRNFGICNGNLFGCALMVRNRHSPSDKLPMCLSERSRPRGIEASSSTVRRNRFIIGGTYGPHFGSVHQPSTDSTRSWRGSWPRDVAGGEGHPARASLRYRAEYALSQLGKEGRSCRAWSIPLDLGGGLPYSRTRRDIRSLLGWFTLSCSDAACMGRLHQSHQHPSADIYIRIPSSRLGLVA